MKYIKLTPLLFLLFIACSKDSPTDSTANNILMPLTIGNYWKYADIDSTRFTDKVQYYTIRVNRDTLINDIKYFIINRDSSIINYQSLMLNRENGLNSVSDSGKPYLVYKYPVQVGEVFINGFDTRLTNIKVISIDTLVKTNAGNFRCVHYQVKDTSDMLDDLGNYNGKFYSTIDNYFALNVGMVKESYEWVVKYTSNQEYIHRFRRELVEYSVK